MKTLDELNQALMKEIIKFSEENKVEINEIYIDSDRTVFNFSDEKSSFVPKCYAVSNARFAK